MNIKDIFAGYPGKLEDKINLGHQAHVRKACKRVPAFEEMDELSFIYADLEELRINYS